MCAVTMKIMRSSAAGPPQKSSIHTASAPAALGPYSQAIRCGALLFCSGQTGLDPTTGALVEGGVEPEARQVLRNIAAVLGAAGLSFDHVVKTTIFLADMADFTAVNRIYAEAFPAGAVLPARSTVQVAALPVKARVEIEVIAHG